MKMPSWLDRLLRWLEKPERDIEILRAVVELVPAYGSNVRKRVGYMSIGEFYTRVDRLERRGFLVTWYGTERIPRRMYLKLTEAGHARLREESP